MLGTKLHDEEKTAIGKELQMQCNNVRHSLNIASYSADYFTECIETDKSLAEFNFVPTSTLALADSLTESGLTISVDAFYEAGCKRYCCGCLVDADDESLKTALSTEGEADKLRFSVRLFADTQWSSGQRSVLFSVVVELLTKPSSGPKLARLVAVIKGAEEDFVHDEPLRGLFYSEFDVLANPDEYSDDGIQKCLTSLRDPFHVLFTPCKEDSLIHCFPYAISKHEQ